MISHNLSLSHTHTLHYHKALSDTTTTTIIMSSTYTQSQNLNNRLGPLQTASEMETLQKAFGVLRPLKSGPDEEAEAFYRSSIYSIYESSRKSLTEARRIPSTAAISEETDTALTGLDTTFETYLHLLWCMEEHSASASDAACLVTVRKITEDFVEELHGLIGEDLGLDLAWRSHALRTTQTAINDLRETMDSTSRDGILNAAECQRVLEGLGRREREEMGALQRLNVAVWEAQEMARRMAVVAAESLRGGRLREEYGIAAVCGLLEGLGRKLGSHDWAGLVDANGNPVDACDVDC